MLKYDATYKRNSYKSQQKTDVSSHTCYLKFNFKGPEYTKNIVFFPNLITLDSL